MSTIQRIYFQEGSIQFEDFSRPLVHLHAKCRLRAEGDYVMKRRQFPLRRAATACPVCYDPPRTGVIINYDEQV